VTFKNSTSDRSTAPVIDSKQYYDTSGNFFTVTYDISGNVGSWLNSNTALVSNVYVKQFGLNNDTLVGTNDGSVDISVFNGDKVNLYVQDAFTTTYTVTPEVIGGITNVNGNGTNKTSVQAVSSPSVAFYLADNPQIVESSIVVDGSHNVVTVDVKNMGTLYLNNAMLVVSQDSTIDEGDQGYYALAYFNNQTTGFLSTVPESNTLDISGNLQNKQIKLSVSETETGMTKNTKLTFSPINLVNQNPVNLVLLVRNTIEGSDSCAVANKAISYPSS
jgi:hypothetical protein